MNIQMIKKYQDSNPERFNDEFIRSKSKVDVIAAVEEVLKTIEIVDGIEIKNIELITDESKFNIAPKINGKPDPNWKDKRRVKNVLPSRFNKIRFTVKYTADDGTHEQEYDLFINKLLHDTFYLNEGVQRYPIYQIVDEFSYPIKDGITLKTAAMPITILKQKEVKIEDIDGNKYKGTNYVVYIFKKKLNPLLFMCAKFGDHQKVIEFFGYKDKIKVMDSLQQEENFKTFKLNNELFINVNEQILENDKFVTNFLVMLIDAIGMKTKYNKLQKEDYWFSKLGSKFISNTAKRIDKTNTILLSLDRIVDNSSKRVLRIDENDKKDTYTVIRYMLRNFDFLYNIDSRDLKNKRIRLYEYQLYPLREYLSHHIFRIINSNSRTLNSLKKTFSNIGPMFIVKANRTSELIRYNNSTNDINLFGSMLRYTFKGPQALTKTVSMDKRDLHPSYVGRLSLIASSAGDPGVSGTFTPFVKTYGYYFTKESILPKNEDIENND